MSYSFEFSDKFFDDLRKHKKSGQKIVLKKIETLLDECLVNPREGTGHTEPLKFCKQETWSRKIDKQHRLVYEIYDSVIYVLSAWGHYRDK